MGVVIADYALEPPPTTRLLWRGLRRRCPLCGASNLFERWIVMVPDCPRCRLHFERVEGHWIGAIGLNTVVSFAALLLVVAGGTFLTMPDVPLVPLVLASLLTALVMPVLFQPVSRTLWTAIDLAVRPLTADELT